MKSVSVSVLVRVCRCRHDGGLRGNRDHHDDLHGNRGHHGGGLHGNRGHMIAGDPDEHESAGNGG